MLTKQERMDIANTILQQLGGRKFQAMTGARQFVALESGLRFKLPGGGGFCRNGINCVSITLDPSDTYTVAFYRNRGMTVTTVSEHHDIYFDQLQGVFRAETGLEMHL